MKLTNLVIIFFIIEISFLTIMDIRMNNLTAVSSRRTEYNKELDSAIDDGLADLVEVDSKRNLILNKEAAVNQFYESLFANFGVIGNVHLENKLKGYIPVILIVDTDGFYIYYFHTYESDGETLLGQKWTEKIPYVYQEGNFIYKFTLGSYVTLYDKASNILYEGKHRDLSVQFPEALSANEEKFDTVRRNAIIDAIEKSMNYYINLHNRIAYQFGITYQFWLPRIDKTEWYRTIDDISMLVIFQGYPYNAGSLDTYNRYALGGARIKKSTAFYITEGNGIKYYHKERCSRIGSFREAYYTKEECALKGAFPCPECEP